MKDHRRSFPWLVSELVLTLTLICSFAYLAPGNRLRAVAAQSTSPSGSFGFLLHASIIDSGDSNGGVALGVMNFDEAGSMTGRYTVQGRGPNDQITGSVTGTCGWMRRFSPAVFWFRRAGGASRCGATD